MQIQQKNFEEIYQNTYPTVLKYMVCKCQNFQDVNELVQDCYIELYQMLKKKRTIHIQEENAYMLGIAKHIVNHYYRKKYQEKAHILHFSKDTVYENMDIPADINLETDIIQKENVKAIWDFVSEKNVQIAKIFYLYYAVGLTVSDIAKELHMNENTVKTKIYRTLQEVKTFLERGNFHEK